MFPVCVFVCMHVCVCVCVCMCVRASMRTHMSVCAHACLCMCKLNIPLDDSEHYVFHSAYRYPLCNKTINRNTVPWMLHLLKVTTSCIMHINCKDINIVCMSCSTAYFTTTLFVHEIICIIFHGLFIFLSYMNFTISYTEPFIQISSNIHEKCHPWKNVIHEIIFNRCRCMKLWPFHDKKTSGDFNVTKCGSVHSNLYG